MKRELMAAREVIDAKKIHDKARAMEHFARVSADPDLLVHAREVKLRAKRRTGELMQELRAEGKLERRGGDRKSDQSSHTGRLKLSETGITEKFSQEAQRLAEADEADFELALAKAKVADAVTQDFVEHEATKSRVARAEARNDWPFRGNWDEAAIKEAQAWLASMPHGKALTNRLASGGAGGTAPPCPRGEDPRQAPRRGIDAGAESRGEARDSWR